MNDTRASGILLHVTSLPGEFGIGDLGTDAYRFIDFLAASGQKLWQVLPLGPTSYGDSPYQSPSAFAGSPLMISPARLVDQGLLMADEVLPLRELPQDAVDFGALIPVKNRILRIAFDRFERGRDGRPHEKFEAFLTSAKTQKWLPDFALFMALKQQQGECKIWYDWDEPLVKRDPAALEKMRTELAGEIRYYQWLQFEFHEQWLDLKRYANHKGVSIMGDIPIFVSLDSADTWSHPELFELDENRRPTKVAGVPPDYFSEDGQLWGNPLYKWDTHVKSDFRWWIERIQNQLEMVDRIRIDHFRGFEAYWEIPAGSKTARTGQWVKAPGHELFDTLLRELGPLPLIAEDLGVITPEMEELRDHYRLPGMKVLQFAFSSDPQDLFLPHNYVKNCVVYTGTHDNDTTVGWYAAATPREREMCQEYLGISGGNPRVAWIFIRAVLASVANLAIFPMQDVLDLGTEARMNYPGRQASYWSWRFPASALTEELAARLSATTRLFGR